MHFQKENTASSTERSTTKTDDRKQWQKPEVEEFTIYQVTNSGSQLGADGTNNS